MKKHLKWPEDDRICHLPDPIDSSCPGCCDALNPKYKGTIWSCIWKKDHASNHTDIWCAEWNDDGNYIKSSYDRCKHCGDPVPDDGMLYCGKACAALDD